LEEKTAIARDILNTLGIAPFVRSIVIEQSESPWDEKALIKWKKDHLDVKAFVWNSSTLLYGRVFRLFLYIYDVLNPAFEYQPRISPDEEKEPRIRDRYNQIWSIYVDSRLERRGLESFYNRPLRRNLFVDSEKDMSWERAGAVFGELWRKESYTYPEIIEYSYDLSKLKTRVSGTTEGRSFEQELNAFLKGSSVRRHIEKIPSMTFRSVTSDILSFAAYHCKDAHIESRYYGICLIYRRQDFMEMIPTVDNTLFLTLYDASNNAFETQTVTETTDIGAVQMNIKEKYGKIAVSD
jgi:hypothetical protein